MKKIVTVMLSLALLFGSTQAMSSASVTPSSKVVKKHHVYDKETIRLANQIIKFDKKNELECKSPSDLLETCEIIKQQAKFTKFDKYDVAAVVFKESKFKQDALNKKDGGTGLMQLTGIKKYHQDTLFWVTNPRDKHQNIIGGLIILEEMRRQYKSKSLAIKHFNGSCNAAEKYRKRIQKIKREIIAC